MTRQNTTETICTFDPLPISLELMGALATGVLREHTDRVGLCAECGPAAPLSARRAGCAQPGRDLTRLPRSAGLATLAPDASRHSCHPQQASAVMLRDSTAEACG